MKPSLAIAPALGLLLAGGVVHGLNSDRWRTSQELEAACARVPLVPTNFGGWEAQEIEGDAREFALAGAQVYWSRLYRKEGHEILAILMVGRGGRMAIHTPEVCYSGAGYDLAGQPMLLTLRSAANAELGTFWGARFVKPTTTGSELQLRWAWNDGTGWQASPNPRWQYAGVPALYKLYFSQSVAGPSQATKAQ